MRAPRPHVIQAARQRWHQLPDAYWTFLAAGFGERLGLLFYEGPTAMASFVARAPTRLVAFADDFAGAQVCFDKGSGAQVFTFDVSDGEDAVCTESFEQLVSTLENVPQLCGTLGWWSGDANLLPAFDEDRKSFGRARGVE